ncbi:MAG: PTS sugar transporter subunit IIA [Deltaproteobacteria bacterium]|nr:PTS sugar transporter subunit IIA [Deltaproteobacteria bacterium]
MLFGKKKPALLDRKFIVTGLAPEGREDAIRRAGGMLLEGGYVTERYIEGMLARDRKFSTAIGNMIAIPHGEIEFKKEIRHTGLVVCTYPSGLEWGTETVKLVVGIAAKGVEHIEILEIMGDAFEDESSVEELVASADAERICKLLNPKGI